VPAGEWNLRFDVAQPGFLGDRAISVHAPVVTFR